METIVLVGGFSGLKQKQRLKMLTDEIKKEFPEVKVWIPEYFEKYGRIGKYLRRKTISEYAAVVKEKIGTFEEPPILIGYSMGGLICRYLVEKMDFPAKLVILVGTPNKGIRLSWFEKLLLKRIKIPCLEDMREKSNFLQILGIKSMPNYYWIGSDHDERVSWNSSIPSEIRYNTRGYAGMAGVSTGHSALIPKEDKNIESSAIPAIIKILKRKI